MHNVCLFAHFDKHDRVAEYVLRYLREIKELGFSIVFISTSRLPRTETERLGVDCSDVILRENTGLDFASWSTGFAKHEPAITGRLLLANDSVYGPIGSLATAFDRLTRAPADFYGFLESIECTPHLQSWFLVFEPHIVRNRAFKAILSQNFSTMTKQEIIFNGELRLSQQLVRAGFKYHALYATNRSGLAARFVPINPAQIMWRELLLYERIPFLKVELLRDNPLNLEDQETILSVVQSIDRSMYRSIKDHLSRSIPGSVDKKELSGFRQSANRLRFDLIRKGYHFSRGHQCAAEIWNFCKLFPIFAASRMWQVLARHAIGPHGVNK